MMRPILVGPLLQIFFTEYLVAQKRLSLQTIASYRDTFRLLLQFVHREAGIEPVALPVATLDADRVLAFLDGLEKDRHNAITSRNLRLTAIRSFFRMVALREPATVGLATRTLAIPMKRTDSKARDYVTREEMDAVLRAWIGPSGADEATTPCCSRCTTRAHESQRSPPCASGTSPSGPRVTSSCRGKGARNARFRSGPRPRRSCGNGFVRWTRPRKPWPFPMSVAPR
jgi:hypothetical protein